MACIEQYLSDLLPDHVKYLLSKNNELQEGSKEYEEEYEDLLNSLKMEVWRSGDLIELAYNMEVPRHALYRFGYTDEKIDRSTAEFTYEKYPK